MPTNKFKVYSLTSIGIFSVSFLITVAYAFHLQPLDGDLTRIGWYPENDFGWEGIQQRYPQVLFEPFDKTASYDVVVYGDSFSNPGDKTRQIRNLYWLEALAAKSSYKVGLLPHGMMGIEEILSSRYVTRNNTKVFIYEAVERGLTSRFPVASRSPCVPNEQRLTSRLAPPRRLSTDQQDTAFTRNKTKSISHFGYAFNYLLKQFRPENKRRALKARLTSSEHFTNSQPATLLFYRDDLAKQNWSEHDWSAVGCGLLDIQNRMEQEGVHFLALIAPDKLTAYSDYLHDRKYAGISKIPIIYNTRGLHIVDTTTALKSAIASGVKDVYSPNDTHWSSRGHLLVAEEVLRYLHEKHLTQTPSQ